MPNFLKQKVNFTPAAMAAIPLLCLSSLSAGAFGIDANVSVGGGGGIDADVSVGGHDGGGANASASVGGGNGVQGDVNIGRGKGVNGKLWLRRKSASQGSGVDAEIGVGGGSGAKAALSIGRGRSTESTNPEPQPEPTTTARTAPTTQGNGDGANQRRDWGDAVGAVVMSRDGDFVGQVVSIRPLGNGARITVRLADAFTQQPRVVTLDVPRRAMRNGVIRLVHSARKLQSTLASLR